MVCQELTGAHNYKPLIIVFDSYTLSMSYQSGSVPVLEEARTMLYVKNHNMITMEMSIFKTLKDSRWQQHAGEYRKKSIRLSLAFISTFLRLTIGKAICHIPLENVVPITHEQNIICRQFAGYVVSSRLMEKKKKTCIE